MSGSRTKQREYRQVIFGVRGSEHVKIVTKVMPFPVGIPADAAVGLVVDPVALTVPDALFQAVAGAGLTLSCTSIDRCPIAGDGGTFSPFLSGFFGFCLGGWTGSEMLSLSESHRRSKKS